MLQGIGTGAARRAPSWRVIPLLAVLGLLAACATQPTAGRGVISGAVRYAPPASADDPWGPYIQEASARFGMPEQWIREVMRQESGGQQYLGGRPITSSAGAMGLMQVMPYTYEGLRQRYGLGNDPYDPHDNIMAGTAYLREMYDRYGSPNFLAAYNAGPGRVDDSLSGGGSLPQETVAYVAAIAPRLSDTTPSDTYVAAAANPCDPLVAYNPSGPCATPGAAPAATAAAVVGAPANAVAALVGASGSAVAPAPTIVAAAPPPPAIAPAPPPVVAAVAAPAPTLVASASDGCDPLAAYDPNGPCAAAPAPSPVARPAPVVAAPLAPPVQQARITPPAPAPVLRAPAAPARAPQPVIAAAAPPPRTQVASAAPAPAPAGRSGVQVGSTFKSAQQARAAADNARQAVRELLAAARVELPTTTPFGGNVYYMVRLTGLSPTAAAVACGRLQQHAVACTVVGSSAS